MMLGHHEVRCGNCDAVVPVTSLHRRALEACEEISKDPNPFFYKPFEDAREVGRESLAAKPKLRWTLHYAPGNGDSVWITRDNGQGPIMTGLTWREASAVCDTLNKLESETVR